MLDDLLGQILGTSRRAQDAPLDCSTSSRSMRGGDERRPLLDDVRERAHVFRNEGADKGRRERRLAGRAMGKVYDGIDEKLRGWIERQRLFFVATAPSGGGGRVNLSPKGPIESFRVVDQHTVAYLDLIGSGAETVAHLRENGRIVVMFCDFEGPPRIVRLHGRGIVALHGDADYDALVGGLGLAAVPDADRGARAVIRIAVERIADSCGYGVPLMEYVGERGQRLAWIESKLRQDGPDALRDYVRAQNAESLDGLPAFDAQSR